MSRDVSINGREQVEVNAITQYSDARCRHAKLNKRLLKCRADCDESRGVGGIFYDHLECADEAAWEANFAFTQAVGEAFLEVFPMLVRRRMAAAFTAGEKLKQLEWRGRYAEFNLVYDRGTLFGLKTGGNIEAILMSLPPVATWA